jgi:CRP/FNR family cyclic AMP-dependent transcriptional regulator
MMCLKSQEGRSDKGHMNTSRSSIIPKLRSLPIFADLGAEEVETLAAMVSLKQVPKGAFIVTQHERGGCMYLLVSGRVKVSLASPDGKELALNYLEAPAHFGEMSLVDSEPRSADVIAVTDVEVLSLDGKDLSAAIQLQPRLALSLIATLSRRLRHTITRLEDMAFHDARHRVMRVILNVATASYEARGVPVIAGLTHYEIATLAGTSRETASRIISSLVKEGVLATKGRRIVVDLFRLREGLESE